MHRLSTELHRLYMNGLHVHFNGVNQALPIGWTWFTFTTADYDFLQEYDNIMAGHYFAAREGIYLIVAKCQLTGLISGGQVVLALDGAGFGIDMGADYADIPAAPTGNWGLQVVLLRHLNRGDFFRVGVSNATLNACNALGGENDTFLSVQRLAWAE